MRDIHINAITDAVAALCVDANLHVPEDIAAALRRGMDNEADERPRGVLHTLVQNADTARRERLPICQDTGLAVLFVTLGQEVHITGGTLGEALNEGVRRGYREGYLRKSVVADPIRRQNTGDNTPAVIHYDLVAGDGLEITVAPKGFGSENMSRVRLLTPSAGLDGVEAFVVDCVREAGPNPCPPVLVGVGVGGTMEKAALLAKQALLRPVGRRSPDPFWADCERRLLERINGLDIGPGGFGGATTALDVFVEPYATHIAGLPVAVNIGCHVTRHKSCRL